MVNRARQSNNMAKSALDVHCGDEHRHDCPAPYQPAGVERFERSDVHAGDRPSGASFASRSAALGCSGAAGTAHPLATLDRHRDAEARRQRRRCRDRCQRLPGISRADRFRARRRLLRAAVGSRSSRRSSASLARAARRNRLSLETVRARARDRESSRAYGAISVSTPGALDGWWTLHQRYGRLKWAELFEPAIHLCESGVPVPQIIGFYFKRSLDAVPRAGLRASRRAPTRCIPTRRRAARRARRCVPQSGSGAHLSHDRRGRARRILRRARSREPSMPISSASAAGCPARICAASTPSGSSRS